MRVGDAQPIENFENYTATVAGDTATEGRFKTDAPRYGVLHLATHGILEEASPLYSHLSVDDGIASV